MKATMLDLRRRTREILRALDQNEPVTILYRGRKRGVLYPAADEKHTAAIQEHPAFGMWRDRQDLARPEEFVRRLRKGRFHGL